MKTISLVGVEYTLDDIIAIDPERIEKAIALAPSKPDNPRFPRTIQKRVEDAIYGEAGEILMEQLATKLEMDLKRHDEKYQDYLVVDKIVVDGVEVSGVVEFKVIQSPSLASLEGAITRHMVDNSQKANFVFSFVGDRLTQKFTPYRITYTADGFDKRKTVKRYDD